MVCRSGAGDRLSPLVSRRKESVSTGQTEYYQESVSTG